MCGTVPTTVVPAEQLWTALDQTLLHSKCGVGSDTPVGQGGTLNKALSPRIVAVHGPTGTRKSTVFPLAITHWSEQVEGLKQGLTICAQPRRTLAQQLCERVRSNRKMHYHDRTVGHMIARESSRDSSTKLLYCTEATVAMMMQTYLVSSAPPLPQELITTVVIDEVHNRSAHSDYVLALTLAAMRNRSAISAYECDRRP